MGGLSLISEAFIANYSVSLGHKLVRTQELSFLSIRTSQGEGPILGCSHCETQMSPGIKSHQYH